MQKYNYIFIILIFFSCNAKKTIVEYKDRIVKDTIIKTKTETLVKRFTDTLTIEQPCDSLGNLKPFKQLIKVPQGNYMLKGINNTITAKIDLKAYKEIFEREYKSNFKDTKESKIKEVVRYKTPLWIIFLCPILFAFGYFAGRFRLL